MHWEVSRHGQSLNHSDTDQTQHWATRIRITLPRLGEVDARLALAANSQLSMRLSAPGCARVLDAGPHDLRQRRNAAGLMPGQITNAPQTLPADDTLPGSPHSHDRPSTPPP